MIQTYEPALSAESREHTPGGGWVDVPGATTIEEARALLGEKDGWGTRQFRATTTKGATNG